jgi:hypothetical protein
MVLISGQLDVFLKVHLHIYICVCV